MGVSLADGVVAVAPKTIVAGTNITTYELDDTITINASEGGGFTLPTTFVTSIGDTASDSILIVESGVAKQITVDNLVSAISIPASDLSTAAPLADTNIITISQDGGVTEVKLTLATLKTYMGVVITQTAPGAPTGVTATAGNASASVAFTEPASNGGSAITGYTVTSSPGGFTGTGSASPISVTGLSNATAYTFTVTATNAIGTGSASSASSAVTPSAGATAPGQVTGLTLGTATSTTQPLTWTAPSNGGSAITDYVVQWSPAGAGTWTTYTDGVSTTAAATVPGLTASTPYDFRVAARNSIGDGSYSATKTGSTAAAGTSYTITGYSGNTVNATADAAAWTVYGAIKYKPAPGPLAGSYWNISPTPASSRAGWGASGTIPPAEITAGQNQSSDNSINGMTPMGHPGAWSADAHLWVPVGSGTSTAYFWIKPVDGVAQCMGSCVVSNA